MARRRAARQAATREPRAPEGAELRPPANLEAYTFEIANDEYAIFSFPIPEISPLPELSAAEREIVRALVEGRSNKQIARQRGTSHHTVANQLRSIYEKLGVSNRVELIRRCTAPNADALDPGSGEAQGRELATREHHVDC